MLRSRTESGARIQIELIDEITGRLVSIKNRPAELIGTVGKLKRVAEIVRRIDETATMERFHPALIKPLRLKNDEVALALHALRMYKGNKGYEISSNTVALMEKLDCYLEGRGQERSSNHE